MCAVATATAAFAIAATAAAAVGCVGDSDSDGRGGSGSGSDDDEDGATTPVYISTCISIDSKHIYIRILVMHIYVMLFCGRVWQWFLPINSSVVIDFELHRSARLNSHYAYVWI